MWFSSTEYSSNVINSNCNKKFTKDLGRIIRMKQPVKPNIFYSEVDLYAAVALVDREIDHACYHSEIVYTCSEITIQHSTVT